MFDEKIMELELAGRTLKVSTGKISRQSSGAIVIQYGDIVLLSTANRSKEGCSTAVITAGSFSSTCATVSG